MEIKIYILVGYEYGAIVSFELNLTDVILSDVMGLTPKKDIQSVLKKEYEHEGKVTILKHVETPTMNLFISSAWDLKLNVWKLEAGNLNSTPLSFNLPTVVNHIECKYNAEDASLEYIIAACYDGNIRLFNIEGDLKNLQITKTIYLGNYPLLELALKDKNVWIVVGDSANFNILDVDTESNRVISGYSSLNKGVMCSQSLIVTFSERQARVWDMFDYRLQ